MRCGNCSQKTTGSEADYDATRRAKLLTHHVIALLKGCLTAATVPAVTYHAPTFKHHHSRIFGLEEGSKGIKTFLVLYWLR